MNKAIRFYWALVLAVMLNILNATISSASLVATDFSTSGDNLLTYDSSTGLEWLDVTETTNLSYNDIINGVGNDWISGEGFRYASEDELNALFVSSGWDGISGGATVFDTATNFLDLWGRTLDFSSHDWSIAITSDEEISTGNHYVTRVDTSTGSSNIGYFGLEAGTTQDINTGKYDIGSALVRNQSSSVNAVPLPNSFGLFGVGLLGLAWLHRQRNLQVSRSEGAIFQANAKMYRREVEKAKRFAGVFALSALLDVCNAGVSSASLVATDFSKSGDSLQIYDSLTGLEWLDITETTKRQ